MDYSYERNRARMKFDAKRVKQAVDALRLGARCVEVRVLTPDGSMHGGRFNTVGGVIRAIETQPDFKAVYVVLNRLVDDCPVENTLSRSNAMARDEDIHSRQWLLVDVDAKRASGTNSTDIEHRGALKLAAGIRDALAHDGWPLPITADSGNGAHLLYRVDLPNDATSKALVNGVLAGLDAEFSRDTLKVDRAVGNAARISKLYGTLSCKDLHTVENPQRLSIILHAPLKLEVVSPDQLRARAIVRAVEQAPIPYSAPLAARGFSMQQFIDKHGIRTRPATTMNGDGQRWQMDCPFDKTHKAPDAVLFEYGDGAKAFKCSHDSCSHQNWQSFRASAEGPRVERLPAVVGMGY